MLKPAQYIFMISFGLCYLKLHSQTGTLEGNIFDRKEKQGLSGTIIYLRGTEKGTLTDFNGNFKIDSIKTGIYDLQISYPGYADTILSSINILPEKIIFLKLEFPPPCKYDGNEKDKTCPICKKNDKVVPIFYGLPIGPIDRKRFYYAGCEITVCDPNWYCKRNKYKF